jgi:hypothetical protein
MCVVQGEEEERGKGDSIDQDGRVSNLEERSKNASRIVKIDGAVEQVHDNLQHGTAEDCAVLHLAAKHPQPVGHDVGVGLRRRHGARPANLSECRLLHEPPVLPSLPLGLPVVGGCPVGN